MGRGDSRRTPKILRRRAQKKLQDRIIRRKLEKPAKDEISHSSLADSTKVEETPSPSSSARVRKKSVAS